MRPLGGTRLVFWCQLSAVVALRGQQVLWQDRGAVIENVRAIKQQKHVDAANTNVKFIYFLLLLIN